MGTAMSSRILWQSSWRRLIAVGREWVFIGIIVLMILIQHLRSSVRSWWKSKEK